MQAHALVEEEADDLGRSPDQQGRHPGHDHAPPAAVRLLVIVGKMTELAPGSTWATTDDRAPRHGHFPTPCYDLGQPHPTAVVDLF